MSNIEPIGIKISIIGENKVGKSCICERFVNNTFVEEYKETVNGGYYQRRITCEGIDVKLMIFDITGSEYRRSIEGSYIKNSNGIVIVYDATNRESFNKLDYWIKFARDCCNPFIKIIIVACKNDLSSKKVVSDEEGKELADRYYFPFISVSAKTGDNINELFMKLGRHIGTAKSSENEKAQQQKHRDSCVIF